MGALGTAAQESDETRELGRRLAAPPRSRATVPAHCASDAGVGDLSELYAALAKRLEHIVRLDVHAPEPVVEEACQFAWSRLAYHRDRVRREAALSWLAQTAVHEALKLIRRGAREISLDAKLEGGDEVSVGLRAAAPEEIVAQRERLARVQGLPVRQQRLVWLHALGLSYAEMASHEGYTLRTVERQLLRARSALRSAEL